MTRKVVFRKFKKLGRPVLCGFVVLNVLILIVFFEGGRQVGCLNAYYDLMQDHYEIRTYGLHFAVVFEEQANTLKNYGILYRKVAGCVINNLIIESVDGYNSVMKAAIKKDIGIDVDKLLDYEILDEEVNRKT